MGSAEIEESQTTRFSDLGGDTSGHCFFITVPQNMGFWVVDTHCQNLL
jgi:hypothetical protein